MNNNRYEQPAVVTSEDAFTVVRATQNQKVTGSQDTGNCGAGHFSCNAYDVDN